MITAMQKTGKIYSTAGPHCPVEIKENNFEKCPERQIVLLQTTRKRKRKNVVP